MKIRNGVTIVELCVVIGIIGVMLAIFIPAVQAVRERAQETVCMNNVRQINLAATMYLEVNKKLPPPSRAGFAEGWTIAFLPFMEQNNLYDSLSRNKLLSDVDPNLRRQPRVLLCPTRSAIGDEIGEMPAAHYILSINASRDACTIWDAPLILHWPWLNSPEFSRTEMIRSVGPHHGGFHTSNSGHHDVRFFDPD